MTLEGKEMIDFGSDEYMQSLTQTYTMTKINTTLSKKNSCHNICNT